MAAAVVTLCATCATGLAHGLARSLHDAPFGSRIIRVASSHVVFETPTSCFRGDSIFTDLISRIRLADNLLVIFCAIEEPIHVPLAFDDPDAAINTIEKAGRQAGQDARAAYKHVLQIRTGASQQPNNVNEDGPTFRATCRRRCTVQCSKRMKKKQEFNSAQAAAAFGGGMQESTNWQVSLRDWDVEAFIYIEDDHIMYAGLQIFKTLTEATGRANSTPLHAMRTWRKALATTALKASVAHAMLQRALGQNCHATKAAVVVDPCCGGLTIPLEAADAFQACIGLGADVDESVLAAASSNELVGPQGACLLGRCDAAKRLPLRDACADAVVSDLPFGKLCGKPHFRQRLYQGVAREAARVLRAGGKAVFLCCGRSHATDALASCEKLQLCSVEHLTMEIEVMFVTLQRLPDQKDDDSTDQVELGNFAGIWGHPFEMFVEQRTCDVFSQLTHMKPHEMLLADVGGGNGLFAANIHTRLGLLHPAVCCDPNEEAVEEARRRPALRAHVADASAFAQEGVANAFDLVLIKEVVHLVPADKVEALYEGIYGQMKDGGVCMTITRPTDPPYPLFEAARRVWTSRQPPVCVFEAAMRKAGFDDVDVREWRYPIRCRLARWLALIRARFWSTFHGFSDDELEAGVKEVAKGKDACDFVEFEECLLCVTARKNVK
ncbi:Putative RNA methylase [Pycnococcus provasolii]